MCFSLLMYDMWNNDIFAQPLCFLLLLFTQSCACRSSSTATWVTTTSAVVVSPTSPAFEDATSEHGTSFSWTSCLSSPSKYPPSSSADVSSSHTHALVTCCDDVTVYLCHVFPLQSGRTRFGAQREWTDCCARFECGDISVAFRANSTAGGYSSPSTKWDWGVRPSCTLARACGMLWLARSENAESKAG